MAGVLVFFPLARFIIEVGLESGFDVGNLHTVEVDGREVVCDAVAAFPVVAEGCHGDVSGIVIPDLCIETQRDGCCGHIVSCQVIVCKRTQEFWK